MFKPTVGPIIGHTTTDHARIFLRGNHGNHNNPVFAGLRYRRQGETTWSDGHFVQLHAHRDMSDVIVLTGLQADSRYQYQAGWFVHANPSQPLGTLQEPPLQWPQDIYCLRTLPRARDAAYAYIVGSCRYLRITAGIPRAPERGDRTFAGIQRIVDQADPPIRGLLMTGDQVYLDDLNIVAPDRTYKDILFKYRTVFSQPHIGKLMSGVPTYMILDDHEIEDNWPANKQLNDEILYANAMSAYQLYQASHSPAHELSSAGTLSRPLQQYWYTLAHGDIEWFVTDSRTERNLSPDDRRILDARQERSLLQWLVNSTARVKFIVTSVLFYPDSKRNDGDAWQAFPQQRLRLLESIRQHRIQNVIFVSGDVHGSMTSRLGHSEDADFEVHTIVSSPFFNSELLPYATASDFIFESPMVRSEKGDYRYELTSPVIGQDNFAHLQVTAQSVRVTFHDCDGRPLEVVEIPLR
ncbi:alkaline phosphatase D [Pseudomonas sp. NFACC32-1]|nr:alkaline phosphatase family protein [Pseudomonas fluorescens]ROO39333.1 phosphodiesterase [Pseudomonas sp. AF76]SCX64454.1 alkaline phosphatase D [Pseudomonas sp. NFACC32-1]SFW85784.1 alkaline phosphatase D [Pseudomonas sp. NFACC09-4]SFY19504.1 alkaline phosphatase D [Pseudomonas sp. NFACC43]SFY23020.1 alkaline phosphatase D [Pseudomonas sp. NFACC47-1]